MGDNLVSGYSVGCHEAIDRSGSTESGPRS